MPAVVGERYQQARNKSDEFFGLFSSVKLRVQLPRLTRWETKTQNKRMESNGCPAPSSNESPSFHPLSCIERALPVSRASCLTFCKEMPTDNELRVRLMVGNLEHSKVIGDAWQLLSDDEVASLKAEWLKILESSREIATDLIDSISNCAQLGEAWNGLSDEGRASRSNVLRCIALNDMKLPDGEIVTQHAQNGTAEQGMGLDAE